MKSSRISLEASLDSSESSQDSNNNDRNYDSSKAININDIKPELSLSKIRSDTPIESGHGATRQVGQGVIEGERVEEGKFDERVPTSELNKASFTKPEAIIHEEGKQHL